MLNLSDIIFLRMAPHRPQYKWCDEPEWRIWSVVAFDLVQGVFGTGINTVKFQKLPGIQGRIKWGGATGAIALWGNLFVSNKMLVWKIFVIQKRYNNTTLYCIPMLRLSVRSPQQQLISLQVWLSAGFSNRNWIWVFSVLFNANTVYLISLVTFS